MRYDSICNICGAHRFLPFGQRSDGIHVLQCANCGHGIVQQFQDDIEKLYGDEYYSSEPASPIGYHDYGLTAEQGVAWAASLVRILKPAGNVLDVGCADGRALQLLGDGYNRFGIELNEGMADRARQAGVEIIARNLFDSRVRELHAGSFDVVLSIAVFEHVADFRDAFRAAIGLLKPDGVLIFEVPLIQYANDIWYRSSLEHLHYPTQSSIDFMFREVLHLSVTGTPIDVEDFGGIYIGLTSPSAETARLAGAQYVQLTNADPASLRGEEIRFRWHLDLMHLGRSRPEILALYRQLKPEDWSASALRRLFDLWAFREEKLKNIEAYLVEVEKARDWHVNSAAEARRELEEARGALAAYPRRNAFAELRRRLREAEAARDSCAAELDMVRQHGPKE
jgi:2-polyprenyl-3-methyl-5-hydroxy-6-metoxy-1,4-benzoquinol methylase